MSEPTQTWATCLTPAGTGAIAVLAVRGPDAWRVVSSLFRSRSGRPVAEIPPAGALRLGWFGDATADEVVVAVKAAEPVPWVEVHCHGGVEVVRLLLETLAARGVRTCPWEEFERRSQADPLAAEALTMLAGAMTLRTAGILLDQYRGAFRREVREIIGALETDRTRAGRLLERLSGHARLGRRLATPWRVVVAGAPNVGKSSLVNALAGFQRCIVTPTPGTTRDVVTTVIAVDGWPVELADTAGVRATPDALESMGVDLARRTAAAADLCLWVVDASEPPAWPEERPANLLVVVNKTDLPAAWDWHSIAGAIAVSARTGAGLDGLCERVAGCLVPDPPAPGAAVPSSERLAAAVEQAADRLRAGDAVAARQGLERLLTPGGDDATL